MATIFNEQPRLGVRLVADGSTIFNNQPVIGIRDVGAVMFSDNLRTVGIDILPADQAIYNDQQVRGAVLILDGRKLYNSLLVVPMTQSDSALVNGQDITVNGAAPVIARGI